MDLKQAKKIVEAELQKVIPKVRLLSVNGRTGTTYLSISRGGRVVRSPLPPSQSIGTRTGKLF